MGNEIQVVVGGELDEAAGHPHGARDGAGFERREIVATGEETSDTRGFLSWRYDWGR